MRYKVCHYLNNLKTPYTKKYATLGETLKGAKLLADDIAREYKARRMVKDSYWEYQIYTNNEAGLSKIILKEAILTKICIGYNLWKTFTEIYNYYMIGSFAQGGLVVQRENYWAEALKLEGSVTYKNKPTSCVCLKYQRWIELGYHAITQAELIDILGDGGFKTFPEWWF